ncbi:hypothetical protein BY458DRAFT_493586 [Sporodiniella umbellata]|nr:hypothetical protein BY458DRAFT_493586 [Sporodiniella umbellata]
MTFFGYQLFPKRPRMNFKTHGSSKLKSILIKATCVSNVAHVYASKTCIFQLQIHLKIKAYGAKIQAFSAVSKRKTIRIKAKSAQINNEAILLVIEEFQLYSLVFQL